jgi:uncharacterized protein (DUF2062 family)
LHVNNVEKPLLHPGTSKHMNEFTLQWILMNVNNMGNPFILPVIFGDIQKLALGQNLCMLPVWENLLLSSVLERHEPSHSHVM